MDPVAPNPKPSVSWYDKAPRKVEEAVKEGSFWVKAAGLISSAYSYSRKAISGVVVQASCEAVYLGKFTLVRVGGFLALPFNVIGLGKDVYDMARGGKRADKLESAFRGMSKMGTILKSTTVAVVGIRAVDFAGKGLKMSFPMWVSGLIGLGIVFELGDAVANGVGAVQTFKFERQLKKAIDTESALRFLTDLDARDLKKRFRVEKGELLKAHLSQEWAQILVNGDPAKAQADGVLNRLRGRLHVKLAGDVAKIATHIIGLVGLIVLIFTPMAPVGYGIIALSVGLAITIAFIDYAESKKPYRPEDDIQIVKKVRHLWEKLIPDRS